MAYFTIDEFCRSEAAIKNNISNKPDSITKNHIQEMIDEILVPLRKSFGEMLIITKGYMSKELIEHTAETNLLFNNGYTVEITSIDQKYGELLKLMFLAKQINIGTNKLKTKVIKDNKCLYLSYIKS